MVWALDKMGSPADRSSGQKVPTEAAGIGTIVRPGKGRSYALPLNELIACDNRACDNRASDKRAWLGEGGIRPDAPAVRAMRSQSKTDFYCLAGFSLPRDCDAGAKDLSFN